MSSSVFKKASVPLGAGAFLFQGYFNHRLLVKIFHPQKIRCHPDIISASIFGYVPEFDYLCRNSCLSSFMKSCPKYTAFMRKCPGLQSFKLSRRCLLYTSDAAAE